MIYSPRALPEVNKSRVHEVPKHNGLIFHKGEVSTGQYYLKCKNSFGKINIALLK